MRELHQYIIVPFIVDTPPKCKICQKKSAKAYVKNADKLLELENPGWLASIFVCDSQACVNMAILKVI